MVESACAAGSSKITENRQYSITFQVYKYRRCYIFFSYIYSLAPSGFLESEHLKQYPPSRIHEGYSRHTLLPPCPRRPEGIHLQADCPGQALQTARRALSQGKSM